MIERLRLDMEKILRDKERIGRQDKSQVTYLEQETRKYKQMWKETQDCLKEMEIEKTNAKKDKEQLDLELKAMTKKFNDEKQKAENFMNRFNEKELELQKAKEVLNGANKQLKQKDADMKALEERLKENQDLLRQATGVKGPVQPTNLVPLPNMKNEMISNELQQLLQQVKQDYSTNMSNEQMNDEDEDIDGEILDEEVNPELIRLNEIQKKARELGHLPAAQSSKSKAINDQSSTKNASGGMYQSKSMIEAKAAEARLAHEKASIPDEMLCISCMDNRKEVMIVSCKHLTYCRQCDLHYNLKNPMKKECPICRKEYKKTLQVLYT